MAGFRPRPIHISLRPRPASIVPAEMSGLAEELRPSEEEEFSPGEEAVKISAERATAPGEGKGERRPAPAPRPDTIGPASESAMRPIGPDPRFSLRDLRPLPMDSLAGRALPPTWWLCPPPHRPRAIEPGQTTLAPGYRCVPVDRLLPPC